MSGQKNKRMCYYPAGNPGPGNVPCSDDEVTHCCGPGNICLSNGYCLDVSQPYLIARGACTSKTWASGCPTQCQDVNERIGSSIINLTWRNKKATYCCGTPISNGTDVICPHGKEDFSLDDAYMLPGRAGLANVTSLNAPDSSVSSSSLFASPTSTSTSSSSSSASPTSTSSSSHMGNGSNHDVAIGAGVGVPLGVLALGAVLWALWERRRANRLSKTIASAPAMSALPPGFVRTPSGIRFKDAGPTELATASSGPVELSAKERVETY